MNNLLKSKIILPLTKAIEKRRRINTLENEIETLKDIIKNELYKSFIGNIKDRDKLEILKKENEELRKELNKYKKEVEL